MDYPKYQLTKFSPDGHTEQLVVRADNFEDFKEAVEKGKALLPKEHEDKFPNDKIGSPIANPDPSGQAPAPICPKHNKPMTKGKWGWYCRTPDTDAPKGWCTYKPK